jgi:hypothetical protein
MKHTFQTATLLSISALQLAFICPSIAADKGKKEDHKKAAITSKELLKTDKSVSLANSSKNMSMEIAGDTAYYNGKAVLLMFPYTSEKRNNHYTICNLQGDKIAFIEVGAYINGQTFYSINYLASHQSSYGGLYESIGEVVELIGSHITDGQLSAANVIKITTENKMKLTSNVAFKFPVMKNMMQPKLGPSSPTPSATLQQSTASTELLQ